MNSPVICDELDESFKVVGHRLVDVRCCIGDMVCVEELISRYSGELAVPEDIVSDVLESLRQHAVSRLAADTQFSQTGVATLHVKFAGQLPSDVRHFYMSLFGLKFH